MSENTDTPKAESAITLSKDNMYGIAIAVLACLLVISLFTAGFGIVKPGAQPQANESGGKKLADAELKLKVEKYVNENLVSSGYTTQVTKFEQYSDQVILVSANLMSNGTVVQPVQFYATNDGEAIFLQGFRTNETIPKPNTTADAEPAANDTVVKVDRPKAQAFIMSFCPYGLQFLKAYVPVIELLGEKADVEVHFVGYAMHGQKEIEGNSYIYCVQKEEKAKLPAYLRCFVEAGNYTSCVATAGIDTAKISTCVSNLDTQYNITGLYNDKSTWSGGRYPQYPVEATLATQLGAGGSPTFILNGKKVSVNRAADAIKQAICATYNTPPAECNTALSTAAEAAGVGPIGGGNGAAATNGGGCGG